MNDPALYHKAELLRSDIENFIDEYKSMIQWHPDGKDSLLDIGCAGGNITIDVMHTMLPKTFSRLVGVDINETMICYAKNNFQIPKVSFKVLDIGCDITNFLSENDSFDHITSSLCLHLVPDQGQTMKNIYNLLQPNGDCLLYILVDCPVFDIYGKMFKKWFRYMEDVDDFISPYYRRVNPEYLVTKYLKSAGFIQYEVKQREQSLIFHDVQQFKDAFQSVVPFLHRMLQTEQEEFMQEFAKFAMEITLEENAKLTESNDCGGGGAKIIMHYKLLTVFAKKNLDLKASTNRQ